MEHLTQDALMDVLCEAGIRNDVLAIMARIPRDYFLEEITCPAAYDNVPLPIGYGQTISQPYIVAKMTELLCHSPLRRVLEIGTGSGYQAAILAACAAQVYTLERVKPLYLLAKDRLRTLGLENVHAYYADGADGLPEHAPYDGILSTAAMIEVPQALLSQLSVDGRLVAPVGMPGAQTLQVITRKPWGFEVEDIEDVRFVPFKRGVE